MSQNPRITELPRELQFDTKFNDAEYERFLLWFQAARSPSKELTNPVSNNSDKTALRESIRLAPPSPLPVR
jgi:hypothetical protein